MDKNISFLLGLELDDNGRSVQQYLNFDVNDWEFQHDVIQMAFPTKTQSQFHPTQPFLSADFDLAALTDDQRQRVRATISLLLYSYMKSLNVEFLINHDRVSLDLTHSYPAWADSNDHNTIRLTRVLECLGIFEMYNIRDALFDFLMYRIAAVFHNRVKTKTVAFWVAAKDNKLEKLR
jgi:hypothetical protein